jgi:hypothetical protein
MAQDEVPVTCPKCQHTGPVPRGLLGESVNCPRCGEPYVAAAPPKSAATRGPVRVEQLVFVGLNGYAVALDRDTGEIVWSNNELKSGYVTLLLDGDRLIVSTNGYIFCLDPLTGRVRWNNRMSGYGSGAPTSLISVRGQSSQVVVEQAAADAAAKRRQATGHHPGGVAGT